MLLEQLLFTFISFALFVYMFFRMISKNDTSYVAILVLEAIGIALNFVEVLFSIKLSVMFVILKYLLAVALPILIIILEKNKFFKCLLEKQLDTFRLLFLWTSADK